MAQGGVDTVIPPHRQTQAQLIWMNAPNTERTCKVHTEASFVPSTPVVQGDSVNY